MRPVHVLTLSAVIAIALPLASCGGGDESTAQATTTAIPAPTVAAVKIVEPKRADKVDIPGASTSLKECLGKNGLYARILSDRGTALTTKSGTLVGNLLAYESVDAAEEFADQMTIKDPMQRGKVIAVFQGAANAKDRKALSGCFAKV